MKNSSGRLIIAAIFIPLLMYIVLAGNLFLLIFTETVIGVSLYEFFTMTEKRDLKVFKSVGIIVGVLIPLFYYFELENHNIHVDYVSMSIVFLVVFFITRQVIVGEIEQSFQKISYTIFGILYISFLFSHILKIKYISTNSVDFFGFDLLEGRIWLLATLLMIWSSDTMAYFIGKRFGVNKISVISPKKSMEGFIAGYIAPIIMMYLIKILWFPVLSLFDVFMIGSIAGIFGPLGDLGESLFKREFSQKDSGTVLLGHGGMLDRFDSLLFVAPMIFYYLKIFVM